MLWVALLFFVSVEASGGPGYALQWDRRRIDVVSWQWDSVPQGEGMTIEFWFKISDPYAVYSCPFNLGVTDGGYMNPSEFSIYLAPAYVSFWLVDTEFVCYNSFVFDKWTHLAISMEFQGNASFYVDGRIPIDCNPLPLEGQKLRNHGLVVMGREQVSLQNALNAESGFDGAMDEFRIWSEALSAAEISAWWNISLDIANTELASKLNLYFTFDSPEEPLLQDVMGRVTAKIGRLDTYNQQISFGEHQSISFPTSPQFIISELVPFGGNGPSVLPVMNANPINFSLPQPSANSSVEFLNGSWLGISYSNGSNLNTSIVLGEFFFAYQPVLFENVSLLQVLNKISYRVFNGTNDVFGTIVFVWGKSKIRDVYLSCDQNQAKVVALGGFDAAGHRIPALIVSKAMGTIFELAFNASLVYLERPTYDNVITDVDNLTVPPIPYLVDNEPGAILFHPDPNFSGQTAALSFQYPQVSNDTAQLIVSVAHINQAPVLEELTMMIDINTTNATITLNSTDVDNHETIYFIQQWPKFGKLVDPMTGEEVVWTARSVLFNWGSTLEAYSSMILDDVDWAPVQVLGEYDFFPRYGASPKGWQPDRSENQWIIIGFNETLYLDQLEIFEIFHPGQIVQISASDRFVDVNDSLSWQVLWHTSDVSTAPDITAIFSPPFCSKKAQKYVRLDLNQTRYPLEIDAIRMTGGRSPKTGTLHGNQVIYIPDRGIHSSSGAAFDVFYSAASDCESLSEPRAITVYLDVPTEGSLDQIPFQTQPMGVVVQEQNSFRPFNFSASLAAVCLDLSAREISINCSLSQFEVFPPGKAVQFALNDEPIVNFPFLVTAGDVLTVKLVESSSQFAEASVVVWVHSGDYTHRVTVNLFPDCTSSQGFFQPSPQSPCIKCDAAAVIEQSNFIVNNCPVSCGVEKATIVGLAIPTVIFLLLVVLVIVWTLSHTSTRVVFFSGVGFLLLQPIGLGLCVIGVQLALSEVCFSPWFIHLGMTSSLACAVVKSFRIERVFALARKMEASSWSKQQIWQLLGVLMMCPILVLVVSDAVQLASKSDQGCCQYNGSTTSVLLALEMILAVVGSLLAFRTRNVPSRFNESRYLALTMYNNLLCGIFCIALYLIFGFEHSSMIILQYVAYFWSSLFMVLANFGPKWYFHWKSPIQAAKRPIGSSDSSRSKRSPEMDRDSQRETALQRIEAEMAVQAQELTRTRALQAKAMNVLEDLKANEIALEQRAFELSTELEYMKTHVTEITAQLSAAPILPTPPV